MNIKISRLSNGLIVATDPMIGLETAAIGVWVNAGARCESKPLNGISHMLEHMSFMGTSTKLIDATDASRLECGYYLVAGGAVAAVCGLLLFMRTGSMQTLLGLGALAGGILVVVVEVMTYNQISQVSDLANLYGGSGGLSYGIGFFLGAGAGVAAALGGLAGMANRR